MPKRVGMPPTVCGIMLLTMYRPAWEKSRTGRFRFKSSICSNSKDCHPHWSAPNTIQSFLMPEKTFPVRRQVKKGVNTTRQPGQTTFPPQAHMALKAGFCSAHATAMRNIIPQPLERYLFFPVARIAVSDSLLNTYHKHTRTPKKSLCAKAFCLTKPASCGNY
jgi:hypothetical protein